MRVIILQAVAVCMIFISTCFSALTAQAAEQKNAYIYNNIIITKSADFNNFNDLLKKSKEDYRKERAAELASISYDARVLSIMLAAYKQFASDYEYNSARLGYGVSKDLSGQFMAEFDRLRGVYLNDIDQNRIKLVSNKSANILVYGHFSHMGSNIKLSLMLEDINGQVKAFEAVGSAEGGAVKKITRQIFDSIAAKRNFEYVKNPAEHLVIKAPINMNDSKTYSEAKAYCRAQSINGENYRLPYARELLNMPGKYAEGGAVFVDPDKYHYAVADELGGIASYKVLAKNSVRSGSRVKKAALNEELRYFCVKGKASSQATLMDKLYKKLNDDFRLVKQNAGGKLSKQVCMDSYDNYGIAKVSKTAIEIRKLDSAASLKGLVQQCIIHYLRARDDYSDKYFLVSSI